MKFDSTHKSTLSNNSEEKSEQRRKQELKEQAEIEDTKILSKILTYIEDVISAEDDEVRQYLNTDWIADEVWENMMNEDYTA